MTTLGLCRAGDRVNLEVDILAKYVQRGLEAYAGGGGPGAGAGSAGPER